MSAYFQEGQPQPGKTRWHHMSRNHHMHIVEMVVACCDVVEFIAGSWSWVLGSIERKREDISWGCRWSVRLGGGRGGERGDGWRGNTETRRNTPRRCKTELWQISSDSSDHKQKRVTKYKRLSRNLDIVRCEDFQHRDKRVAILSNN